MTARSFFQAALLLTLAAPLLPAESLRQPMAKLTVLLMDAAGVEDKVLTWATNVASQIFAHSRIGLSWVRCGEQTALAGLADTGCGIPSRTRLLVRILPKDLSARVALNPRKFGLALLGKNGTGVRAYIFYDRVEKFSQSYYTPRGILLGRILAHELGHLLLGSHSHSSTGIMQPVTGRTLDRTSIAGAYFTVPQARLVRAAIRDAYRAIALAGR